MSIDLCQVPAGPAPEGTTSNFENPTTLVAASMSLISIMVTIAVVVTAPRLYTNFRKLTLADYFALVALLMSIGILGIQASHLNTSRHIWDVPACYFDGSFAQGVYFPTILFQMGAFFAKASIFLLFSQLFTTNQSMRITIWVGHTLNFLIYWSGVAIATYYEVPHVGETWLDTLDDRALVSLPWWQAQSAIIVALDIYIFVLPLPTVMRLQLPSRKRISLVAVFSVALLGIAASIASLVQRVIITNTNDTSWVATILALFSCLQLNAAIIVSSAPAFASFARTHLPEMSAIKSLLLSLTSVPIKTGNSESTRSADQKADKMARGDDGGANPHENHRYYELNEPWGIQSGVSADLRGKNWVEPSPGLPGKGGIMRTVAFEQTVRPSGV